MSAQLYALGRWCHRHAKATLLVWLAVALSIGGLAATFRGQFEDVFKIPGSSSQKAIDKLRMTFPQGAMTQGMAVFVAAEGQRIERFRPLIEETVTKLEQLDFVSSATSPWNELVSGMVSDDDRAAIVNFLVDVEGMPTPEQLQKLTAIADAIRPKLPEGATVDMGGHAFNVDLPEISPLEGVGLLVALVVLAVVLGSLVAAGLPVATAVIGVAITMSLLLLVARLTTVNSTTPMLALMLGLAVGIDYALFILSRHRDQLSQGMEPEESTARAVGTAGSAVVFAGLTVFIALLGLSVSGIPFLTIMGVFAAVAVVFGVIIALTLLPALMRLMGERMRPKRHSPKNAASIRQPYRWWITKVTGHPIAVLMVVTIGLGTLTIPGLRLHSSLPNSGQHSIEAPDRITYDLVSKHFGVGNNGPLVVTADIIGSDDPLGLIEDVKQEILTVEGVAAVPLATPNLNAEVGLIQVVPTTAPDDPATAELVQRLRDRHDEWQQVYGVETAVTGITALQIDVSDRLTGALLPFGLLVVGLSLILLAAVFRSVWVPIKATAGFLLSMGGAFGATTLVFNDGWLKEIVNVERGMPVISFLPILLMGVLFGLAMDYEVFLVSRIREEYVHGKPPLQAICDGYVASGPVVVAAALIMFSVFAFFVPGGMASIKQIAFALAVGVAIDAFLVRMTFVPAALALLGERAWWLPRWLDRLLPTFDVEGEVLSRELELAQWPGTDHVLYAEAIEVEDVVPPTSLALKPGNVIGIAGPVATRTGTALALTGRLGLTGGRARVAGHLLPGAEAAVHRRADYVDLAHERDIVGRLSRIELIPNSVVFIDSMECVSTLEEHHLLTDLVVRARSEGTTALVLCASNEAVLTPFNLDGVLTTAQQLDRSFR
ncbi:MMPL family transporter [Tessaracoccus sp. OH4464_COT-324]|uniref:MMPL family transporter n=1 Tax=Tessaracoccus sp. OH4464_COT-324 TaxID=2491059 RepID=UPI000F63B648|nr:MMPL family transporter [Tessaracoccus sp. OH4464_COT-324]RRD47249.1 MMPL family transporter [Tessaracoccus sp. OH4464_COT-324]